MRQTRLQAVRGNSHLALRLADSRGGSDELVAVVLSVPSLSLAGTFPACRMDMFYPCDGVPMEPCRNRRYVLRDRIQQLLVGIRAGCRTARVSPHSDQANESMVGELFRGWGTLRLHRSM